MTEPTSMEERHTGSQADRDLVERINKSTIFMVDGRHVHLKEPPSTFPTLSEKLFPLMTDLPDSYHSPKASLPIAKIQDGKIIAINGDYKDVPLYHAVLALTYGKYFKRG